MLTTAQQFGIHLVSIFMLLLGLMVRDASHLKLLWFVGKFFFRNRDRIPFGLV